MNDMIPSLNVAIVGKNSMISRVLAVDESSESVNVEILVDAAGHALTDQLGNVLISAAQLFALTDGTGAPLIDGSGNYLMSY